MFHLYFGIKANFYDNKLIELEECVLGDILLIMTFQKSSKRIYGKREWSYSGVCLLGTRVLSRNRC